MLLDESDGKISIAVSHSSSAHGDCINLFVIITRRRKSVKCQKPVQRVWRVGPKSICVLCRSPSLVETVKSTVKISLFYPEKIEVADSFQCMICVFDMRGSPIGFSGFGILEKKRNEIRDWNFLTGHGIWQLNEAGLGKCHFEDP